MLVVFVVFWVVAVVAFGRFFVAEAAFGVERRRFFPAAVADAVVVVSEVMPWLKVYVLKRSNSVCLSLDS